MGTKTTRQSTVPAWLVSAWLPAAVTVLLIALAFGWLAREMRGVRDEVATIRSRQQALSADHRSFDQRGRELEAELDRRRSETEALQHQLAEREERIAGLERAAKDPRRAAAPVVASMVLSAAVRSDIIPTLALPATANFAELRVDLEGDDAYRGFRAALTTSAGARLWTGTDLATGASEWGSEVVVRLPAGLFEEGAYELALEGLDEDGKPYALGRHAFNVAR